MKVLCGIVTYNPEEKLLQENIERICRQVDGIIVFDNASVDFSFSEKILRSGKDIIFFREKENKGIAYALKYIMEYARKKRYDWVLTLDQDSLAEPELIRRYAGFEKEAGIGAMTCIIQDRSSGFCDAHSGADYDTVECCITSGCLMNVNAYFKTRGYDEWLFIDQVDFDICYALREAGYKIIRINYQGLWHEVGHGRIVHIFHKEYKIFNHPAWRRYYMTRNGVYIARKYRKLVPCTRRILKEIRDILLVFLYENEKMKKLKMSITGLIEGLTAPIQY